MSSEQKKSHKHHHHRDEVECPPKPCYYTGATGATGPNGINGGMGSTGPAGSTGLQGPKGDQGENGQNGQNGLNGLNGSPGGATGSQGLQGTTGVTGPQGTTGTQGATGISGPISTNTVVFGTQTVNSGLSNLLNGSQTSTFGSVDSFSGSNFTSLNGGNYLVSYFVKIDPTSASTDNYVELLINPGANVVPNSTISDMVAGGVYFITTIATMTALQTMSLACVENATGNLVFEIVQMSIQKLD